VRLARAALAPVIALAATGGACIFIDQFPEVAPDPPDPSGAGGSGGGASATSATSATSTSTAGGADAGDPDAAVCEPGASFPCYTGPLGTLGKGVCVGGARTCSNDGSGFGPCKGQSLPTFEGCGVGKDTNCDGLFGCPGAVLGVLSSGDAADQRGVAVAVGGDETAVVTGAVSGVVQLGGQALGDVGVPGQPDALLAKLDTGLGLVWARRFADANANGVVVAPSGSDVIVTGGAVGDVDFGGGVLFAGPAQAIFLARFDQGGVYRWAERWNGDDEQLASAVATDLSGDAVITGTYRGTLAFGGFPITSDHDDAFVARFDPAGQHVWSRALSSTGDAHGAAVAIAGSKVIVAGTFKGTITLGADTRSSVGSPDVFVAAFDGATGVPVFLRSFGGPGSHRATGVAIDPVVGQIVVSGGYKDTLIVNNVVNTTTPSTDEDAFLLRLDASGNALGATVFRGAGDASALGVAVDPGGDVLLTGVFQGSLDFGGPLPLTSAGLGDGFLLKFSPALGSVTWAKPIAGADEQASVAVAASGLGHAWITGFTSGPASLGLSTIGGAGGKDLFVGRYSP
jgi:hypothetical protein